MACASFCGLARVKRNSTLGKDVFQAVFGLGYGLRLGETGGVSADDVIDLAGVVTERGQAGSGAEGAVEHADGEGKRRTALVAITPLQRLVANEASLLEDAPFFGGGAALSAGCRMAEHVAQPAATMPASPVSTGLADHVVPERVEAGA